jgi:hypothetical protein
MFLLSELSIRFMDYNPDDLYTVLGSHDLEEEDRRKQTQDLSSLRFHK